MTPAAKRGFDVCDGSCGSPGVVVDAHPVTARLAIRVLPIHKTGSIHGLLRVIQEPSLNVKLICCGPRPCSLCVGECSWLTS